MKRTTCKQLLSWLMAAAMVLTLAVLPARASQFSDITDPEIAQAADVLSAMGVVNGTGNGKFSPNNSLTRAQFCKMAIEIMGNGELAMAQMYRTVFADVKSTHWGRGYVNLAATLDLGDGVYLMRGTGNGNFAPDRAISYREAVTTLLRVLGYGEEAERFWPQGALQTASSLKLDKGLNIKDPAGPISRGQAVLLFYRMLSVCPKGSEQTFLQAKELGKQVDDVIVLSVGTSNGVQTLITTQGEYPAAVPVDNSLAGQRGSILLDRAGRFIIMLTSESSSVSFTVSRRQNGALYDADGVRHTIQPAAEVYTDLSGEAASFESYQENIHAGDSVTLYLDAKGQVVCMLHREAAVLNSFVVVRGTPSAAMFAALTGTERGYSIQKNGKPAAMSDIKEYDVATYDPTAKVLYVCDVRLRCVYEGASPSPAAPSEHIIAAGGNEFTVLDDAVNSFAGRKIGDTITLMFTQDGRVAGLYSASDNASHNAIGVLSGDGFRMLYCNLTLNASAASVNNESAVLFSAASNRRDTLTLTSVYTQSGGTFYPARLRLNSAVVIAQPAIYEQTSDGLRAVELSEVPENAAVAQYHLNSAQQVDIIILKSFSGEGTHYGRIDLGTGYELASSDGEGPVTRIPRQSVWFSTASGGTVQKEAAGFLAGSSCFGSFTTSQRAGSQAVLTIQPLKAISGVPSSSFYTADGQTFVRTSEGVFPVADDVQCCNLTAYTPPSSAPSQWFSGWNGNVWTGNNWSWESSWTPEQPTVVWFSSLSACRSFSSTVTIHLDTLSETVRIVSVP